MNDHLKAVTKEVFFEALKADNRDIMPSIRGPWRDDLGGYETEWRTKDGNRVLFGKSIASMYWLA